MLYINTLYIKIHLSLKIRLILFAGLEKSCTFAPTKHRGVEQLVARWAHNPKVVCSSQASATKKRSLIQRSFFSLSSYRHRVGQRKGQRNNLRDFIFKHII